MCQQTLSVHSFMNFVYLNLVAYLQEVGWARSFVDIRET